MSDGYTRIYPPRERILFDGGKNNKFERTIIEDNESPDCLNVVFSAGAVETRQGVLKLNTAAVGAFAYDGLYTRRDNSGAETMVAFNGGLMYALAGTSFITVPSAQSVFTAGSRVSADMAENYMFFGNGGVSPHKWNGTNFTLHGVPAPTVTHTAASSTTGVLTGGYQYKVTYVNSNLVEGNVGPVNSTFTAASATIGLTSIPVAPISFGVNARKIYRNTVATPSTFKLLTTISDNTTTTYSDSTADVSLGAAAPTDNGVPPNYSVCRYFFNRLFVNDPANPNFVWYSEIGQPYTFGSLSFFKVGDNTSDLVKGFGVFESALVVYCEKSVWLVYMPTSTATDWKYIQTKSPYGSKSPFGIVSYNNKLLFPAVQGTKFVGFAALNGDAIDNSTSLLTVATAGSQTKSDRVEPDMFLVQETYLPNISSIIFKNKAYLSVTYGTSQTTNNRIYIFDFSISNLRKDQEASWVPFTGLNAAQFTVYGGKLYFASSTTNGFVYQMESGTYDDDGAAINSYYWTKEYSGVESEYNIVKDFRYTDLLIENSGAWFMNVTHRVDSDSGSGDTTQVSLNPGGSLWGTMVWGRDVWGGGSAQKDQRLFLGGARGKRVQFQFSNQNTVGQKFKVYGQNFRYNLKGYR